MRPGNCQRWSCCRNKVHIILSIRPVDDLQEPGDWKCPFISAADVRLVRMKINTIAEDLCVKEDTSLIILTRGSMMHLFHQSKSLVSNTRDSAKQFLRLLPSFRKKKSGQNRPTTVDDKRLRRRCAPSNLAQDLPRFLNDIRLNLRRYDR